MNQFVGPFQVICGTTCCYKIIHGGCSKLRLDPLKMLWKLFSLKKSEHEKDFNGIMHVCRAQ